MGSLLLRKSRKEMGRFRRVYFWDRGLVLAQDRVEVRMFVPKFHLRHKHGLNQVFGVINQVKTSVEFGVPFVFERGIPGMF